MSKTVEPTPSMHRFKPPPNDDGFAYFKVSELPSYSAKGVDAMAEYDRMGCAIVDESIVELPNGGRRYFVRIPKEDLAKVRGTARKLADDQLRISVPGNAGVKRVKQNQADIETATGSQLKDELPIGSPDMNG